MKSDRVKTSSEPEAPILAAPTIEREQGGKFTKIIIFAIIVFAALATFFYFKSNSTPEVDNKASAEEVRALVEKVGKLIALPEGETPTIAIVNDTESLTNQAFFARAKVGDQVLLYTAAQKAFLYDPKANIILEVASLNLGDQ